MLALKTVLYGSGNYHLAPGYSHYLVPLISYWTIKSDEEKTKLIIQMSNTVKANNVSVEVPNEQKLSKKKLVQKQKRTRTVKTNSVGSFR